jgi:Protein of unknown function (DUF3107)
MASEPTNSPVSTVLTGSAVQSRFGRPADTTEAGTTNRRTRFTRPGGHGVEVKIGVQFAPRELVLESAQTPADVAETVAKALEDEHGVLTLVDERGRRVIVPVAKLAYVEIAESTTRQVGFITG